MKQGFTTGSCASAAARGAVHMLLTGEIAEKMTIMTPAGIEYEAPLLDINVTEDQAWCAVKKISGDDPDVTAGMLIYARASYEDFEGADKETSPAGEVLKSLKAGTGFPDVKSGTDVEVSVIPGITAALGGSAILGAVVNHDFCTISLSDYLTPRELIRKRLECAAISDMVIVLYNPGSRLRTDALKEACEILMEKTGGDRLCGVVRNIGREGEEYRIMTLSELKEYRADMYTTVFIGNSQSRVVNGRLITPRGYEF